MSKRALLDEPAGSIRSGLSSDLGLLAGTSDEPSSPPPSSPQPPPQTPQPQLLPATRPERVPQAQANSDDVKPREPRTEHSESVVLSLALTAIVIPLAVLEPFPLVRYAPCPFL